MTEGLGSTLGRMAKGFGHFWWDFLVGDSPQIFFATLVIVGTALLTHHYRLLAVISLPLIAVIALVSSAYSTRKRL